MVQVLRLQQLRDELRCEGRTHEADDAQAEHHKLLRNLLFDVDRVMAGGGWVIKLQ